MRYGLRKGGTTPGKVPVGRWRVGPTAFLQWPLRTTKAATDRKRVVVRVIGLTEDERHEAYKTAQARAYESATAAEHSAQLAPIVRDAARTWALVALALRRDGVAS